MNVIDLFCGCGGFSKGFEQAGFNVRLGIDIWEDAVATYKANFPHAATIVVDISTLSGEDLLTAAGMSANEVDVIIGGPPCQGFSLSGKRMLDDPRNVLYKSFVRMVETIQPKAFVMENVPGLVRLFNGQVKEQIIEDFTNIGYKIEMRQLTASDFGVPQARTRVFFVGINKDKIKSAGNIEKLPASKKKLNNGLISMFISIVVFPIIIVSYYKIFNVFGIDTSTNFTPIIGGISSIIVSILPFLLKKDNV